MGIIQTTDNEGGTDGVGGGEENKEDLSDGGSNTGLIAAGVIIPLFLLVVITAIAILVLFVLRKRFE